jgi:8-oxo-dGTP pyrophosphatase MutT (NUDIX family)
MEIVRHFTASIYIIYENKVLLHKHKKYDLILPVGGHIEENELPGDAAIREAKEESGLDIVLFNSNCLSEDYFKNSKELNRGEHLNLHKIKEGHEHIDFVFYARTNLNILKPEVGESKSLSWYSKDDILNSKIISDEVKIYALDALEKVI